MKVPYTAEYIRDLIMSTDSVGDVERTLKSHGIPYRQNPDSDYFNIRIKRPDGYIRIYENFYRNIVVQAWTRAEFSYSGVSTFEPSGRRSF